MALNSKRRSLGQAVTRARAAASERGEGKSGGDGVELGDPEFVIEDPLDAPPELDPSRKKPEPFGGGHERATLAARALVDKLGRLR